MDRLEEAAVDRVPFSLENRIGRCLVARPVGGSLAAGVVDVDVEERRRRRRRRGAARRRRLDAVGQSVARAETISTGAPRHGRSENQQRTGRYWISSG